MVEGAVGEGPPALCDVVILPVSDQLHAGVSVGVSALPVLLAELPPAGVRVLVAIEVGAFAVLDSVFPLPYGLSLDVP